MVETNERDNRIKRLQLARDRVTDLNNRIDEIAKECKQYEPEKENC